VFVASGAAIVAAQDIKTDFHGATPNNTTSPRSIAAWAGNRYGGMGSAQTTVNEYLVGTLVDMFDAKSKNLVFRGTAQDELSDNPDKNAKKLEKASAKMFKNFPPSAKKDE